MGGFISAVFSNGEKAKSCTVDLTLLSAAVTFHTQYRRSDENKCGGYYQILQIDQRIFHMGSGVKEDFNN